MTSPRDPVPNGPADSSHPILGDFLYEACWTADF
jgi:hypothetical protein